MSDLNIELFEKQLKEKFFDFERATSSEWRINCPFCGPKLGVEDTKKHMYVNPSVRTRGGSQGAFNCFKCGSKGWGLEKLQLSVETAAYVDYSDLIPDSVPSSNIFAEIVETLPATQDSGSDKIELPEFFSTNFATPVGNRCLRYLLSRGITMSRIQSNKIGFCEDGPLRSFVVLPVFEEGTLVYYVARSIFKKVYKNASARKRGIVYNCDAILTEPFIVICEGIFDAMSFGSKGIALLGKTMSQEQRHKILRRNPSKIFICLDTDAKKEAVEIGQKLASYVESVSLVCLPAGKKDAADCSPTEIAQCIKSATPATKLGSVRFLMDE